jgi:PEP-CTERM motif-containing protein
MKSYARVLICFVVVVTASARFAAASPVALQNATATFSQFNCTGAWPVSSAIDGIFVGNNGWAIAQQNAQNSCVITNAETAWFETSVNQGSAFGTTFTFTMSQLLGNQHTLGDFELSYTTDARVGGFSDTGVTWTPLTLLTATATNGAILSISNVNEVTASGTNPQTSVYTITAQTFATGITGFRLGTLLDPAFFGNGPGRQPTNGNFVLTELQVDAVNAVVPEPATMGLVLVGLGTLARRRTRQ